MEEEPVAKKRLKTKDETNFNHPKNAADLNLNLLKSQLDCDVFFLVGSERKRVGAHKLILRPRSPVFTTMFSQRWESKNGNKEEQHESSNVIELEEDEPSIFWSFLEYIYADVFTPGTVEAIKLLHLAHYYDVKPLSKLCEELLSEKLKIDNVLEIFTTAQKYSLPGLMSQAVNLMTSQFDQLVNSPTFENAEEATLVYLLQQEDLAVKESKLFSVLLGWADKQIENSVEDPKPERAGILKNLIPLVRFPTMTAKEFGEIVAPTNILSPQTTISLFMYLTVNKEKRTVIGNSLPYGKTPRIEIPCGYVDIELYKRMSRPALEMYPAGSMLLKISNIGDVLTFKYSASARITEKNLKVRIASLMLKGPRYKHHPFFRNSSEVADNDLSIRVALSLTLVPGASLNGYSPQLQAHEEIIALIPNDKTEVVMLDKPHKPWELISNNTYKITVRFLSDVYAVPAGRRDENDDFFSETTLRTQIIEENPFGTIGLSCLAMSCATGPPMDPLVVPAGYYLLGTTRGRNAMSTGLHLIRSLKIAFA